MSTQGIEQMLSMLRTSAAQATGKPAEATPVAGALDFAEVLKTQLIKETKPRLNQPRLRKSWPQAIPIRICMKS